MTKARRSFRLRCPAIVTDYSLAAGAGIGALEQGYPGVLESVQVHLPFGLKLSVYLDGDLVHEEDTTTLGIGAKGDIVLNYPFKHSARLVVENVGTVALKGYALAIGHHGG